MAGSAAKLWSERGSAEGGGRFSEECVVVAAVAAAAVVVDRRRRRRGSWFWAFLSPLWASERPLVAMDGSAAQFWSERGSAEGGGRFVEECVVVDVVPCRSP